MVWQGIANPAIIEYKSSVNTDEAE